MHAEFEVRPMLAEEGAIVAQMHYDFFGVGEMHGHSLANLGVDFLRRVFYELNLDNPYFFVDVALYRDEIIGFSVYASDWRRVSRQTIRCHFGSLAIIMLKLFLCQPIKLATHVLGNLRFMTDAFPPDVKKIDAWYMLLAIKPSYRTREFREQTGIWVNGRFWDHLVDTLREQGCESLWTAPGAHNGPINDFFRRQRSELIGQAKVQGVLCNFYRVPLVYLEPRPE